MKRNLSVTPISTILTNRRRLVILTLVAIWVSIAVLTMTWSGSETSAQTVACSISQITSGQASTASINAAISDDGSRIALAVARNPTGGNPDLSQEIFIYNIGTGGFTQVTNSTGGVTREVSISANGSRVAFISNRNLTGGNADLNPEVFFYDAGTAIITQVTNTTLDVPLGSGRQYSPSISGDGSQIAFLSSSNLTGGNGNNNDQYFLYDIMTGNFRQLTDSTIAHPAPFTPIGINFTGTEINFLSSANLGGQNPDGNLELFRWDFQDGIQFMTVSTGGGFESFTSPSMNSSGTLYAFSSNRNLNGTNPDGAHEIFLLQSDFGVLTSVTEGNGTWSRKTWPDLSANGTHIAFQGDRAIVRYDIAANDFTIIPATPPTSSGLSGSRRPSISADGSRIAFYSDDDLTGGNTFNNNEVFLASCAAATPTPTPTPTATPTPQPTPVGAVEKIVFHSQRDDGTTREIYIMNSDGTDQRRLTYNSWDDMEPWISRDGRKIVFQSDRGTGFDIFTMDIDGTNQVNLTNNGQFNIQPSFSPDGGKIAFMSTRDGNNDIFIMNSDGSTPVNLTASSNSANFDPAFSADGSKIVFRSDRDGNNEIYVMNADGTNQTRLTFTPNVLEEQPMFSPDGSKITYNTQQDASSEIWVMNANGSSQTQLTSNAVLERHPSFSPDGTRIAFTSARDGNNEIYVMNANGSNPTRLTNATGSDYGAMWGLVAPPPSPGIPKVAFASQRGGSVWQVYTMNADGSGQTPLTSGVDNNYDPVWSPDGTKIVFTSERDGDPEIFVMKADGSSQTQLTFNNVVDDLPAWSPDGTKIAFSQQISPTSTSIVTMFANGSGQTIITPAASGLNDYAEWSPDGTKIAFTRIFTSDAQRDIYVMNSDGSNAANPVRLTNNAPLYDNHPDWSPDGTRIAYTCSDPALPSNWEICSMNATDGSDVLRLTTNGATDLFPAWSSDSGQILFQTNRDGNTEIYSMRSDGAYLTNLTSNAASDSQPEWQPNIAWAAVTPTGSNVAVQMGLVSVTFAGGVSQAGTTSQYTINPASAGPLPQGFTLGPGLPAYDISTTAVYTAPVTVCLQVPSATSQSVFDALRLLHYENGALRDRTVLRDFATKIICAEVTSLSPFVVAQNLIPNAAQVPVSGRVLNAAGYGINKATITLADITGNTRTAITNAFGYYRFDDVAVGQSYVASVRHKSYAFNPGTRIINVNDEIADLDFTADGPANEPIKRKSPMSISDSQLVSRDP